MARFGELITWQEITGDQPSVRLVHEHLEPYRLQDVLLGLARLSAFLYTWQNRMDEAREQEAIRQTLPTYYPKIKTLCAATPNRFTFSRISLLFVAKQALVACERDGREVEKPQDIQQVTACCLMANDLLLGRQPLPDDTTIDKAANLLSFSNYVPQGTDSFDIARNLLLVYEIAPQLSCRRDYRNLEEEFTQAAHLTPKAFCELTFCAATKFILNVDEQRNPGGLILDREYFRHTQIPPDQLETFLNEHTIAIDRFQAKARGVKSLQNDFLIFQERPLVEFATGQFLCIDPGFLLEKAGRAFYWALHLRTPSDRRVHLLGYWASVVDEYAHWLFAQTYEGTGHVTPSPRFSDGSEACDVMVQEGTRLILFEVKASTLTAQAKYGFDSALLKEELVLKAIEGEEGQRKGVAQLRHAISRFQDGDPIEGIHGQQITMIYPVLVFLDSSFTSPYLGSLYREHFDRGALKRRPTVSPLYAITVNEIEDILPHTDRHDLTEIFDDYYRNNRTPSGGLALGSFSHGRVPILIGEPRGKDVVRERFQRFGDDLVRRIFPTLATPDAPV